MPGNQLTRHTTYFELLEALSNATGCPLCEIETDRVKRYFESLMHESINDPGIREQLVLSRGYCARHARMLLKYGKALGIAILYQDQIKRFLSLLDHPQKMQPAKHNKRKPCAECPVCQVQNECRKRYVGELVEWLHDTTLHAAFERCRGLCVPHFLVVMDTPMNDETRRVLIKAQREWMTSLLQELEEFHRKHDYRFRDEGFGSESDSWSRAVRMMIGEHEVF